MSSIDVRLPDGKTLSVAAGSSVLDVAASIGPGLAKAALAGRISGELVDLRLPLDSDCGIEIVTAKDPEAGEIIRHSAEHVMADAVKRLFPDVQIDVGRTDHSEKFQYDFLADNRFSPEDVERIEKEMQEILRSKQLFRREVVSREDAIDLFRELGEDLKVARIGDIPDEQDITLFRHGDFVDLCRGPHVQRTDQIGAVKLTDVSGSYWKGDESGPQLQRIYGTAFGSKKELKAHLAALEAARQRDHRRVGVDLGLFALDPLSPGSPFYLPRGTTLYNGLVEFMRSLYPRYGYQEVITPQLFRAELFKTSGHYDKFHDDMFWFDGSDEGEELGIKAMNCPGHSHLYGLSKRSYRELPMRLAEFSRLHRNERSGTLNGLSRVRSMAQDDGHVYCEPDQMGQELARFFEMVEEVYGALGLTGMEMSVSTRPDEFLGEPADWDVAERILIEAVEEAGYACAIKEKDAAFYAPKVECDFRDVLGRVWTLATIQIDMAAPARFGLRYVGRDGELHQPAMLHRAVLGSLERFIAIYIEHTGGDFPFWLSPLQVAILPIAERHVSHGNVVHEALQGVGVRSELDDRSETLGFKIRDAETHKVPLMLVIGDQEEANVSVAPRVRKSRRLDNDPADIEPMSVDQITEQLRRATQERHTEPFA